MDKMRGIRMGGAQCRAPCLRGTCEAWGGPGWWTQGQIGGILSKQGVCRFPCVFHNKET